MASIHDDSLDALASLLGYTMFKSMKNDGKAPDFERFRTEAESKREEYRKQADAFLDNYARRNAKTAKALFDAYKEQGFSEVQAFELLKETFILR